MHISLTQEFNPRKGWQEIYSASIHRIREDAEPNENFDNYLKKYWNDIMSVEKHTRYDTAEFYNSETEQTIKLKAITS